jgi:hypothetical protein
MKKYKTTNVITANVQHVKLNAVCGHVCLSNCHDHVLTEIIENVIYFRFNFFTYTQAQKQ